MPTTKAPVVAVVPKSGPLRPGDARSYLLTRKKSTVPKSTKRYVKSSIDASKQNGEKVRCEPNNILRGDDYENHTFAAIPQVNISDTDLMMLMPPIVQGDSREQRIGSKIQMKNINCRFMFYLPESLSQSSAHSTVMCRLLVLSCKRHPQYTNLKGNWGTNGDNVSARYFKDGEDDCSFEGDNFSLNFPVNSALFTTHLDKKFVLNRGHLGSTTGGHGPTPLKIINYNHKCKNKLLKYTDDSAEYPENFAPFAMLIYSYASGTVRSSPSSAAVTGSVSIKANWKNM